MLGSFRKKIVSKNVHEIDDDDEDEYIDLNAIPVREAMSILRERCRRDHSPDREMRILMDSQEHFDWLVRYWQFVKWNEHGNEASLGEDVCYCGLLRMFLDPDEMGYAYEYLTEGEIDGRYGDVYNHYIRMGQELGMELVRLAGHTVAKNRKPKRKPHGKKIKRH